MKLIDTGQNAGTQALQANAKTRLVFCCFFNYMTFGKVTFKVKVTLLGSNAKQWSWWLICTTSCMNQKHLQEYEYFDEITHKVKVAL